MNNVFLCTCPKHFACDIVSQLVRECIDVAIIQLNILALFRSAYKTVREQNIVLSCQLNDPPAMYRLDYTNGF